jgi:hypothetical protein
MTVRYSYSRYIAKVKVLHIATFSVNLLKFVVLYMPPPPPPRRDAVNVLYL